MSEKILKHEKAIAVVAGLCLAVVAGCATPKPEQEEINPALLHADAALQAGDYTQAIIDCIDLARENEFTPGLQEMQGRILQAIAEERAKAAQVRDRPTQSAMIAEYDQANVLPDTYRLRQHVQGLDGSFAAIPNEMQEALSNPVSIHLVDVDLAAVVTQIGASENINIVADGELGEGTITLHVDDVPLAEVLEYVGRNLNVTFSVGRNVVWVTSGAASAGGPPLLTRIYRLRRGITAEELEGAPDSIGIIEAVTRFVPEQEGADIVFNKKTNAILAKNTRENLALIEDIIDALDIRPAQVLIEARFLSTSVEDLRELGIDWVLQSPIGVTKGGRLVNGTALEANETQIDGGATLGWTEFANKGNGLNGTFTGILTDPMFQATLHALETYGKARTLSMPRVTAINNTEAHIRIGEDFRYYEDYDLEDYEDVIYTGNGNRETVTRSRMVPSGSPTLEELGIELTATPSVGSDMSSIDLKLAPEISEFVRWEYFMAPGDSGNVSADSLTNETSMLKLPVFRRNLIETEVVVRSGETVVMGGLMQGTRQKTTEGIPFFSKIPLIGQLFRHDVWEESRQNLIVFVTATIISDAGEELIPLAPPPVIDLPEKVELGTPSVDDDAAPAEPGEPAANGENPQPAEAQAEPAPQQAAEQAAEQAPQQ